MLFPGGFLCGVRHRPALEMHGLKWRPNDSAALARICILNAYISVIETSDTTRMSDNSRPVSAPFVLVIESRPADALIVSCYLQYFGCPHNIAKSFSEASSFIGRQTYNAVLIDISTPSLEPVKLIADIREHEQRVLTRPSLIFGMTALSVDDEASAKLSTEITGYLYKPCNPTILGHALGIAKPPFTGVGHAATGQ